MVLDKYKTVIKKGACVPWQQLRIQSSEWVMAYLPTSLKDVWKCLFVQALEKDWSF